MNRLKKIFSALLTLNRNPGKAIADAWSTVFEEARKCCIGDRRFSDALDMVGSVINAVVKIAEEQDKPKAQKVDT